MNLFNGAMDPNFSLAIAGGSNAFAASGNIGSSSPLESLLASLLGGSQGPLDMGGCGNMGGYGGMGGFPGMGQQQHHHHHHHHFGGGMPNNFGGQNGNGCNGFGNQGGPFSGAGNYSGGWGNGGGCGGGQGWGSGGGAQSLNGTTVFGDPHAKGTNGQQVDNIGGTNGTSVFLDSNGAATEMQAPGGNQPVQTVTAFAPGQGVNAASDTPVYEQVNGQIQQVGTTGQMDLDNPYAQGVNVASGQSFYDGVNTIQNQGNGSINFT